MRTLPVELWWKILRLAIRSPGLFETKGYSDVSIWHAWDMPEPKFSMGNKLRICLVSRSWREMGVALLYEHIFITKKFVRSGVMSKLVSIFEQHVGHHGYGRSTKRLDIHGAAMLQPYFPVLLQLLNLCHNIRIFILFNQKAVEPERQFELSSLLQNRFHHSLRRMRFHALEPPSYRNIQFPNVPLEALELSTGPFTIGPSSAFANVSALCIDLIMYYADALSVWRFPALRHLTFRDITNDWGENPRLRSFMSTHGPQLYSLQLEVEFDADSFRHLAELLAPATSLRCLILRPGEVLEPSAGKSFPSITHIGIYDFDSTPYRVEEYLSESAFPSLQCIRFLARSNDQKHPRKQDWILLLEAGRKRKIRIEDRLCRLFQV